jgi:hypothetical protein
VATGLSRHEAAELARAALRELEADEPDLSPAQTMGGPLSWAENWTGQVEAERDPINAPAMRPHVIAPCQELRHYRAMRLHCRCGKGLDYLALITLNGVLVVSSPRLLPPKLREGGPLDLGPIDDSDPGARWTYARWERMMRDRSAVHRTAYEPPAIHAALGEGAGVVGDSAKRQWFTCNNCGATETFSNITLLRMFLEAIADGEGKVQIGGPRISST